MLQIRFGDEHVSPLTKCLVVLIAYRAGPLFCRSVLVQNVWVVGFLV
jgi:hypothetical protein